SWGYCKDTAPTTLTGGYVGPLPHRAMPRFPYDPAKDPPPAHVTEYDRVWNTPPAGRRRRDLPLVAPPGRLGPFVLSSVAQAFLPVLGIRRADRREVRPHDSFDVGPRWRSAPILQAQARMPVTPKSVRHSYPYRLITSPQRRSISARSASVSAYLF